MLLQFIQDTFSDPSMIGLISAGSGIGATAGSITTMLVQKALSRKKDSADVNVINYDVIDKQFKSLWENVEQQGKVIKELQEKACYREPCNLRINGNSFPKPINKTKKTGS